MRALCELQIIAKLLLLLVTIVSNPGKAWAQERASDSAPRSAWSRGPREIVNAPLLPLRGFAGGFLVSADPNFAGGKNAWRMLSAPFLTAAGGVVGVVQGGISLLGGIADTVTGGYFELLPPSWSELSIAPIEILPPDSSPD